MTGRDRQALKQDLQKILNEGGIDVELYRAVSDWRNMVAENGGKPVKKDWESAGTNELIESMAPLLLGVEEGDLKARRYFEDYETAEEIGDLKFAQRARLWETMTMYHQKGGLRMDEDRVEKDIAGVVLKVITELNPEINVELATMREGETVRV